MAIDLEAAFNQILIDHNIVVPSGKPDDVTDSLVRKGANLPALPDQSAANRIIADTIGTAAMVDPDKDRERARSRMRDRLILEPNKRPHIANIEFEGEVMPDGDISVSSVVALPGFDVAQKVVPLIYVGIDYLTEVSSGKFRSNGTFQCLVFKPENWETANTGPLKALPLGVADAGSIRIWNRIAREMRTKNWPEIKAIPNNLRRLGVCTSNYLPTFDPEFKREKGSRKRLLVCRSFGQKLYLSPKSQIPDPDVIDGKKSFQTKHVFRVKLSESSPVLTWLGREGKVRIDNRVAVLDVLETIDPFAILGRTTITVDVFTIDQTARGYLNQAYNERNPLYQSAIFMGLVLEQDPHETKRIILEDLMLKAIEQIKLQMQDAVSISVRALSLSTLARPHGKDIYQGHSRKVVLSRLNKPNDVAAEWIAAALECEFLPKSSLHKLLRAWLINSTAEPETPPLPQGIVKHIAVQAPTSLEAHKKKKVESG
ncbi:MAG: hypothetical protein AAB664_03040, partial [Patescibacteria group bacterium]